MFSVCGTEIMAAFVTAVRTKRRTYGKNQKTNG